MSTFFSKILYFAVGMFKAYFFIGFIVVLCVLLIMIGFALLMPEDCTDFFNQEFVDIANNSNPDEKLRPYEVTTGDRIFLAILILIVTLFIWPYVINELIRGE